jgi:hypothetical protein
MFRRSAAQPAAPDADGSQPAAPARAPTLDVRRDATAGDRIRLGRDAAGTLLLP